MSRYLSRFAMHTGTVPSGYSWTEAFDVSDCWRANLVIRVHTMPPDQMTVIMQSSDDGQDWFEIQKGYTDIAFEGTYHTELSDGLMRYLRAQIYSGGGTASVDIHLTKHLEVG